MESTVNINQLMDGVSDLWSPHVVGEVNDYDVKAANLAGDYVEHVHADTDEIFIVLAGRLYLEMAQGTVTLDPFDVYTVPAGVAHRPRAEPGTRILNIEPRGTTQNGQVDGNTGARSAA